MTTIRISEEYSETLGARYIEEGEFSGEDFRKNFLIPRFKTALGSGEKITIDLDGGYGNPVSFLEEAFGGLAREYGTDKVLEVLQFVSLDEPSQVTDILGYIMQPYDNKVYKNALIKKSHKRGNKN